jgi:hypothetical protein
MMRNSKKAGKIKVNVEILFLIILFVEFCPRRGDF